MDGQYILPNELAILFAVWFGPPLLIASAIIIAIFRRAGLWHRAKGTCISLVVVMFVISPVLGFLALRLPLPRWLGVSDNLWFLPLSYVIVLVVAIVSALVVTTYVRRPA